MRYQEKIGSMSVMGD